MERTHRHVDANGIRIHVVEEGQGPAVLLCHGFPETWYSWRHQLSALSEGGYRAIAPDMRGYGETSIPEAIDEYTLLHLVGDMVGLINALGVETAVIAGHDWGAVVAWHAALLRPDRFTGVIALSVPFVPRGRTYASRTYPKADGAIFYQEYFQTPGVAEADFAKDVRLNVRGSLYSYSGDRSASENTTGKRPVPGMVPRTGGMSALRINPATLPPWITEADIDVFTGQFERTGYTGGLNWYRNAERNWESLAPFEGLKVKVPALFIAGDRDLVMAFPGVTEVMANLSQNVPLLRRTLMLPGCGHWTQQERAQEVNAAMIGFLHAESGVPG